MTRNFPEIYRRPGPAWGHGLFYWNFFRKTSFDNSRRGLRNRLPGTRQRDRLIVVSFEVANLLSLLKVRRDRLASQSPHFTKGEGRTHDIFHRSSQCDEVSLLH